MKIQLRHIAVALVVVAATASGAVADCFIGGTIEASPNPDPSGPAWVYTVTLTWDTGTPYALSHMDLILDLAGGTCTCQDFDDALEFGDPIGSSDGAGGCSVDYYGELGCGGDPSIPDVDGVVLKFEPYEEGCEPGTAGQSTFVFHSNLPPAPIDEEILSVVDKYALNYCFGNLSGDFPSMTCDPVDVETMSFGTVKGTYR